MAGGRTPNVYLRGGSPPEIADEERLRFVSDINVPNVKILCGNRYEHFEASPEVAQVDGIELRIFVWSRRTYVAE
ncbi:DUF5988 family protein [Actinomadura sp. WAC 06369]|uniref:DUF5988 family protein n=1 Tax=Actinomadura sp. WAC 06369 TaxID=2203193 RepID=UPI000F77A8CF|nr:DUF5988 family protein [Actinomadura sp. WAC 06369]RSN53255.1 hypothetical protein DMH08_27870 [Actinomadura sp. WAC 06369]